MGEGCRRCGCGCGCCSKVRDCKTRLTLVGGIVFGICNNLSTVYNARTLYQKDHRAFAYLTVFFLFFPGLVTSAGFLVLHLSGVNRRIRTMGPARVALCCLVLLAFYPAVPVALCAYALVTGRKHHLASLAKLFEGFLDDGPQFVLKLVVVVLQGVGLSADFFGVVFTVSMVTSFLSLVLFGLHFNERDTFAGTKFFICTPMFAAFTFARAFTLAVFLKETLGSTKELLGGLVVLAVFCVINMATFKFSGQDPIRSVVFGLCSLLIPAGYSNDSYYYQCPNQPLSSEVEDSSVANIQVASGDDDKDGNDVGQEEGKAARAARYMIKLNPFKQQQQQQQQQQEMQQQQHGLESRSDTAPSPATTSPMPPVSTTTAAGASVGEPIVEGLHANFQAMKSGVFLLLYTVFNAILLGSCAAYLASTRTLGSDEDNALILPQILAVIPGCFFALSRALLLPDLKPRSLHRNVWTPMKVCLCLVFTAVAYCSLVPALFWGALYKVASTVDNVFD